MLGGAGVGVQVFVMAAMGAAGVVAGGPQCMADSQVTWDASEKVRPLGSVWGELDS